MPPAPPPGPPSPWRPRTWTLRTQLVVGVLALVTVVMAGTGLATIVLTRSYLSHQLAADLANAARRLGPMPLPSGPGGPTPDRGGGAPGGGTAVLRLGLVNGRVTTGPDGVAINHVVNQRIQRSTTLDAGQIQQLLDAGLGPSPRRVDLGGDVGRYLLVAQTTGARGILITGVPTAAVDDTVARLTNLVVAGTLLGLVAVGVGGGWLIRRNLAPLDRVAGTARQVSGARLDSGDVRLPTRVAPEDTNPHTEVGQVGLALNSLLDNVESALRTRHASEQRVRQFVADASHELRTPLASIRGYAELSRREREPVPPAVARALDRVEAEAQRMSALVEDLLLLARLDEGRPLEREPVDLSMLVVDAVSDAHAAGPDHTWLLDLPAEPVQVVGDRFRLHQVLTNLLANARTHTPPGTRVTTALRTVGEGVELGVTDDGPGIPDRLRDNVFERFTRGDAARTRTQGSTGLGLSIVAAVTAAHGGRVGVTSRPGHTAFTVALPFSPHPRN